METTQPPPSTAWGDSLGYEGYVGRWSRQIAPAFVTWLGALPKLKWLDVACGTGALTSAIIANASPSEVIACDLSLNYLKYAQRVTSDPRVRLAAGNAQNLPFPAGTFDVVACGLVLNFLDADSAIEEQRRVTLPSGCIAAYVWDYAAGYELTRVFWDAAITVDSTAAAYDPGRQSLLCKPDALLDLFRRHGLKDVAVNQLDGVAQFPNFSAYWQSLDARQGTLAKYLSQIDEPTREKIKTTLSTRLHCDSSGLLKLQLRAFAVRGTH